MKTGSRRHDLATAIAFLLPNFTGFLIFTTWPVLFSLVVSFSNWNLQRTVPFQWTRFGNFSEILRDPQFWVYFVNTGYFMIGIPISIAGSLILAVMLSQKLKGMTVYRTLFYLPSITSGVALMILWKALYRPDFGPINATINWLIATLNINDILGTSISAPQWLLSTKNIFGLDPERVAVVGKQFGLGARDAIIIMGIWVGIGGSNMLLYIAALTNVPQELVEAAQLDGAGKWSVFRNVTWPQLAPTTFFIVPAAFSAFGTFLLRQFMLTIPPALDEAASIDGASAWRVFWDVILPLTRPGLVTLAIFTFMGNYGAFYWPLILIKSEHLRTLPIGMLFFDSKYGSQTNLIMAGSVMSIIPLVILFALGQKFLVRGIQLGAVKG